MKTRKQLEAEYGTSKCSMAILADLDCREDIRAILSEYHIHSPNEYLYEAETVSYCNENDIYYTCLLEYYTTKDLFNDLSAYFEGYGGSYILAYDGEYEEEQPVIIDTSNGDRFDPVKSVEERYDDNNISYIIEVTNISEKRNCASCAWYESYGWDHYNDEPACDGTCWKKSSYTNDNDCCRYWANGSIYKLHLEPSLVLRNDE